MAKFEIAEAITGRNEGGYANNPSDTGGETYAGIARNYWGNWSGWKVIDSIKQGIKNNNLPLNAQNINKSASKNIELNKAISSFYKQNFWDVNKLDLISDQQLANTVYDFGVNSGTGRASKFLQASVNSTFNSGLVVDGQIGSKTITAINSHEASIIYNEFNRRREDFYRSIAKGNQAQFLKSWLSRLKPYQK